jgi:hypothetical protein
VYLDNIVYELLPVLPLLEPLLPEEPDDSPLDKPEESPLDKPLLWPDDSPDESPDDSPLESPDEPLLPLEPPGQQGHGGENLIGIEVFL